MGCTSIVEKPIPPITLHSSAIKFHSQNSANLAWKTGKVLPSNGGYEKKVDVYQYGETSQQSFMKSLRDNLMNAKAYQSVNLTTQHPTRKNNQTIIVINFLKTSVGQTTDCFPIHLTVRVNIKNSRGIFVRRIFVYSTSGSVLSHKSFRDQQIEVSQKLMHRVIAFINQRETTS